MVESEANQLSEEIMLGAVLFGHEQMQVAISAINELVDEANVESWGWEPEQKIPSSLMLCTAWLTKSSLSLLNIEQNRALCKVERSAN